MNKNKNVNTVIYTNFSPYENTGNILDFLHEKFENVYLFSLNFHVLKGRKDINVLKVFKNGKNTKIYKIPMFPIPEKIIFLLLPLRSALILFEIFVALLTHKEKLTHPVVFFTVNAYIAWVGNFMKTFGLVDKVVFWVWDYYPPHDENKIVVFMRYLYWQFDKMATKSDRVFFLNQRLENLRKKIGVLPNANFPIIPIGTNPSKVTKQSTDSTTLRIGFLGVVKRSQGLDFLFDAFHKFVKKYKTVEIHIIGDGPGLRHFRDRSINENLNAKFHGLLSEDVKNEDEKIKQILGSCDIGFATYKPEKGNVSIYGDPSKIKRYLSLGLPVITTDVFVFSRQIQNAKAGIIVTYGKIDELTRAINRLKKNSRAYRKMAFALAKNYYYKKIYQDFFS